jgi:hypothetical protein
MLLNLTGPLDDSKKLISWRASRINVLPASRWPACSNDSKASSTSLDHYQHTETV